MGTVRPGTRVPALSIGGHASRELNRRGDALHLAIASYYRLDVLLTWNCRHLANPNEMQHIRAVNRELGLSMPLLTTPLNYVGGDDTNA